MPKARKESSSCEEQNTAKLLEILNNEPVGENLAERVATIVAEKINNGLDNMEELLADKELDIQHLEQKVQKMASTIEKVDETADNMEQYSRRPDLRFQGIAESLTCEDTDKTVPLTINEHMQFNLLVALENLERSHRLGPKKDRD